VLHPTNNRTHKRPLHVCLLLPMKFHALSASGETGHSIGIMTAHTQPAQRPAKPGSAPKAIFGSDH